MRSSKHIREQMAQPDESPQYSSAKEIAILLRCSISSAHRICQREGITKVYVGRGANGLVRYVAAELKAYLARCTVKSLPATARSASSQGDLHQLDGVNHE